MRPALLILAAGEARRFGALKQLAPVGPAGEALLDYAIFDAVRAGFGRILIVIRRDIEPAMRVHAERIHEIPLTFVFQETVSTPGGGARTKPWGTAHAVLSAAGVIEEPFAVMNADDFYGRSAFEQMAAHLRTAKARDEAAVLTYPVAATLSVHGGVSRAVCTVDDEALLSGITEMHDVARRGGEIVGRSNHDEHLLDPASPVSMNLWGFTPAVFAALAGAFETFIVEHGEDPQAEYRLPDAVSELCSDGLRVRVLSSPGGWMGMTFAADRAQVRLQIARLVRAGEYPAQLAAHRPDREG